MEKHWDHSYGDTTRYVNLPDASRNQFVGESREVAWSSSARLRYTAHRHKRLAAHLHSAEV
jgi:hypothetical protein